MSTARKILLGMLMLVVVGGAMVGIYFVFFSPSAPLEKTPQANTNTNKPVNAGSTLPTSGGAVIQLPNGTRPTPLPGAVPVARGGLTLSPAIAPVETLGASLDYADIHSVRYYDRTSGKFYKANENGTATQLSSTTFPGVKNVTWSQSSGKAVLEFPDGAKLLYDFDHDRQTTLPSSWTEFSFSPASDKLAMKSQANDPASAFLVVANADGSNPQAVQQLGENADRVQVNWSPTGEVVATSQTGENTGSGREILFIGLNGENFKSATVGGAGFASIWSPDGSRMLFSSASAGDGYRPRLGIMNAKGDAIGTDRRAFELFTLAEKCTFASSSIMYCAVPDTMIQGAGLEPRVLDNTPDSFYRVNADTGTITLIGKPDTEMSVAKIMVSPDGKNLFFVNRASGNIHKMQIK